MVKKLKKLYKKCSALWRKTNSVIYSEEMLTFVSLSSAYIQTCSMTGALHCCSHASPSVSVCVRLGVGTLATVTSGQVLHPFTPISCITLYYTFVYRKLQLHSFEVIFCAFLKIQSKFARSDSLFICHEFHGYVGG